MHLFKVHRNLVRIQITMKKTLLLIGLIAILYACGSVKTLKPSNIAYIYLEYDSNQDINFGSTINGKIMAMMVDGKPKDVSSNKSVGFESNGIKRIGENQFQINRKFQKTYCSKKRS